MTTDTQNQIQWLAFDRAYVSYQGSHEEKMRAGYRARNAAIAAALKDGLTEGPAEHPVSFSCRSRQAAQATGELEPLEAKIEEGEA